MINSIILFSIKHKLIVFACILALIGWGGYSALQLPIDAVPDITNNQVQIITQSPALAAQEVEQFITAPLELAMANLPKVEEIRSISRFGLSVITVVFTDDADVYWARQVVSEQIKQAEKDIPAAMGLPGIAPVTTGLGEIFQYTIRPEKGYEHLYTPMQLRTIQDWVVRRQLAGIPGVIEINGLGGYTKQYEVSINPERLRAMNVSLTEVYEALQKNNANTGGGYIEKGPQLYYIRGEGLATSLQDIANTVIRNTPTVPLLVKDVATVRFGHAARFGAMTRNGEGEVVGGITLMLKGANSAQVIANVKERIAQVQQNLPEGLVIDAFLDRTKLVDQAIHTVSKNLIEGGLIVIFVLVLLLGNWRAGLVVASVIPLALLFAFGMMNLFGVSANLMSLGAVDFGLVVDGAVIIVESSIHFLHLRHNNQLLTSSEMDNAVYESAVKVRKSAAFGEIIILIVYLPVLALVGVEGKMFKPMAQTVSFAIIGAFLLSLTYVPMASAFFLSRNIKHGQTISDRIMQVAHRLYDPLIRLALRKRIIVTLVAVVLFAGSLILLLNMGGEFIPTLEEGDFAVETRLKPGSSLQQTIATTTQAERILLCFPEVIEVVSKIGTSDIPTDPMPLESGDVMVVLKEKDQWQTASNREDLAEAMERALAVLPGVNFDFQQPIQMRFNELMTGVKSDIAIKIYGENLQTLAHTANEAAAVLAKVKGVADIKVEQITGLPQILVRYDRAKLAQYGVSIDQLNTMLQASFAGRPTGVVFEGERRFELVVRLDSANRTNIDDINNLYVDLPNGSKVPLQELAQISYAQTPMQISRDNAKRRIVIGANIRGRDVESVVAEIRPLLAKQVRLPAGYYFTYGGQFENLQKAKARLGVAVPVVLLLIFALLYFTFSSLKEAFMVFTAIPLSAIGGILALWVRGMPFSISAGVGFIALFGVAVLNGIVLIAYFNQLEQEGIKDVYERILKGVNIRLRPVLMTAAVASLGFLPMALSGSSGAEVQKPLATVVIGGLISATLLTLIVLPVIYSLLSGWKQTGLHKKALFWAVIIGGTLLAPLAHAQVQPQVVSLPQALELALQNNGKVKIATLTIEQQQALQQTAYSLPKTNFDFQYGQISALQNDYSYNISQQIAFPSLYAAQLQVARKQVQATQQQLQIQRNELARQVKLVYYELVYHYARLDLLRQQDTLYQRNARAANVRYRTGETNKLEQFSAQARQQEIGNLIAIVTANVAIAKRQLMFLLNTDKPIEIADKKPIQASFADSAFIAQNPQLAYYRNQTELALWQTKTQKRLFLPDFRLGYFNQSIERVRGFQVYEVGLALPLWFRPYKAAIQSARIQEKIAAQQLEFQSAQLQTELDVQYGHFRKFVASLAYYQQFGLPQANQILQNAEKNYLAGEINYVEYVQNMLQAWQIKEAYLEQLFNYNATVANIEFMAGQVNTNK